MTDAFGIVANVTRPDSCLRLGAKVWVVYVPGSGHEGMRVYGMTRGGRMVNKYVGAKGKLENFRPAWVPPGIRNRIFLSWPTRAEAEAYISSRWLDRLNRTDTP